MIAPNLEKSILSWKYTQFKAAFPNIPNSPSKEFENIHHLNRYIEHLAKNDPRVDEWNTGVDRRITTWVEVTDYLLSTQSPNKFLMECKFKC